MPLSRWLLCAFSLAAMGSIAMPAAARPLRVMTFNVRVPLKSDGINSWQHRRDLMVRTIREEHPDVMGTQELHKRQGDYIVGKLPGYAWFGEGRRGGSGDEHMGVFYRKDTLKVLKSGNFWLSDTPRKPGSISWGQPYPRMVTWALFKVKASGRTFYFYDTHLPYRKQDVAARMKSAAEILQHMKELPEDIPFVLTGDFNATPASPVHARLTAALHDAWLSAPHHEGPKLTFHNFTGSPTRRIDWILYRGLRAKDVRTVTTHQGKRYPSDHFPVMATLAWPKAH